MESQEFADDNIISQLDWDDLPDFTGILHEQVPAFTDSQSNPCVSSWIGQVENILMKDDDEDEEGSQPDMQIYDHFLQDILADSPTNTSANAFFAENSHGSGDGNGGLEKENRNINNDIVEDPVSKKRTRQLRNRDAAVRSRERKKMYVRDLEMKSRYLEGECRRLGRLLQCFIAENRALRLSLQKGSAFGASSAKQESAVLLLESLLLGSLLWFLGLMCLFNRPKLPKSIVVPLPGPEGKGPGSLAVMGSNVVVESFLKSRGCKASGTKMKLEILALQVSC